MGGDRFQLYAAHKLPTVNFDVLTDEEGEVLYLDYRVHTVLYSDYR